MPRIAPAAGRTGYDLIGFDSAEKVANLPDATEAHHDAWTRAELARYIEPALDAFGFTRTLYGSDWPVSTDAIAYDEWIALLDDLLAGVPAAQLALLQPGVSPSRRTSDSGGPGTKLVINGAKPSQVSFVLDGADINDANNNTPGSVAGIMLGVGEEQHEVEQTIRDINAENFRTFRNWLGWAQAKSLDEFIAIQRRSGADVRDHLDAVAALRIAVFRDWPYLYDGDAVYEREYLDAYALSPDSVFVLAFDGDAVLFGEGRQWHLYSLHSLLGHVEHGNSVT